MMFYQTVTILFSVLLLSAQSLAQTRMTFPFFDPSASPPDSNGLMLATLHILSVTEGLFKIWIKFVKTHNTQIQPFVDDMQQLSNKFDLLMYDWEYCEAAGRDLFIQDIKNSNCSFSSPDYPSYIYNYNSTTALQNHTSNSHKQFHEPTLLFSFQK